MANQVLSRPMFKQSQAAPSVSPTVGGIGSMTTPDQNAQALKNMFAPQIPAARPTQSFPSPQVGYKRGGEVIDGVAHFVDGNEVVVPPPAEPGVGTKLWSAAKDIANIPYQVYQGVVGGKPVSLTPNYDEEVRRARGETGEAPTSPAQKMGAAAADIAGLPVRGTQYVGNKIDPREVPPVTSLTPNYDVYRVEEEAQKKRDTEERLRAATRAALAAPVTGASFQDEAAGGGILKVAPKAPPPPPDPIKESIQTNLQAIKERREASDKQREENKYLALLSAGLGIMGGKSRNAFENIGAGGQQGIATFAGLEKARREDDASRRQEQYQQQQLTLQNNQLAQQKEIAFAQLAKDPDAVRTYAALGGWKAGDPPEKFAEAVRIGSEQTTLSSRIKALQDIVTAAQNPMSGIPPERAKEAQEELLRLGLGSKSGGGQFPGFTPVAVRPGK
jgi:hypothetical protein